MNMSAAEFQNFIKIRAAHDLMMLTKFMSSDDDLEKMNDYHTLSTTLLAEVLTTMEMKG